MGKDGAIGMKAIKQSGGFTMAQVEGTQTVFGMPKSAIELNRVDKIRRFSDIPQEILRICKKTNLER
jgi:two-component system chemotaxis response regulator CheB